MDNFPRIISWEEQFLAAVSLTNWLGYQGQVLLVLLLTGIACTLLGSFLIFLKLSMITDALSHSILLGIVLAFLLCRDLHSPFLLFGAGLFGILTVFSIEGLAKTKMVQKPEAVGIIFPFFFSLAVILISRFAGNTHLDLDMVLLGQAIMIPLNTLQIGTLLMPKALFYLMIMFLLNSLFVILFFKELKVLSFDQEYAQVAGFSSSLLFYTLMTLTSFTAVASFDAAGTMLTIALFVGPPAAASMLCHDLKRMLFCSLFLSVLNTCSGFYLALYFNVSIAGMIALTAGVLVFICMFCRKVLQIG